MKRIQYTEEQKKKLIEMSKSLYPEYKEIHINGGWIYFNKGIPLDTIPIFEFCMTHLYIKLIKENFNSRLYLLSILDKESDKHIIDYLYEEFLKIK